MCRNRQSGREIQLAEGTWDLPQPGLANARAQDVQFSVRTRKGVVSQRENPNFDSVTRGGLWRLTDIFLLIGTPQVAFPGLARLGPVAAQSYVTQRVLRYRSLRRRLFHLNV